MDGIRVALHVTEKRRAQGDTGNKTKRPIQQNWLYNNLLKSYCAHQDLSSFLLKVVPKIYVLSTNAYIFKVLSPHHTTVGTRSSACETLLQQLKTYPNHNTLHILSNCTQSFEAAVSIVLIIESTVFVRMCNLKISLDFLSGPNSNLSMLRAVEE